MLVGSERSSARRPIVRWGEAGCNVTHNTTTAMAEVLTPIWERVLRRPSICADDNFFDLGGDSLLAVELFTEIARVCGRELAPVTIYCTPTIASLAATLEKPDAPRFPASLQLKAGSDAAPIFLEHGLGGTAMDFFQLVKHIATERPIYGLQAKGTDGVDEPFDRIEDLAQYHLDAIRELQPRGPYFLIGYSLGGLVALEMAQRLTAEGEKIALLTLLESYPHPRFLSLKERARLAVRLGTRRASSVGRSSIKDVVSSIIRPSERRLYLSRDDGNAPSQLPAGASHTPAMQHAREKAYQSLTNYRPRFYKGIVRFVQAETLSDFPDDPVAVWSRFADDLQVEVVPGDHLGILGEHYDRLASVISRQVAEASA